MGNGTIPGDTHTGPGSTGSYLTPPTPADMDPANWISRPAVSAQSLSTPTVLISPEELASWTGQATVTRILAEG